MFPRLHGDVQAVMATKDVEGKKIRKLPDDLFIFSYLLFSKYNFIDVNLNIIS